MICNTLGPGIFGRAVISLVIPLVDDRIVSYNNLIWRIKTRVQAFQPFGNLNNATANATDIPKMVECCLANSHNMIFIDIHGCIVNYTNISSFRWSVDFLITDWDGRRDSGGSGRGQPFKTSHSVLSLFIFNILLVIQTWMLRTQASIKTLVISKKS